jgi:hypothetical protein
VVLCLWLSQLLQFFHIHLQTCILVEVNLGNSLYSHW